MKQFCNLCGNTFVMGRTGTVDGCDSCTGVVRDEHGYAGIAFNLVNNHLCETFGPDVVKLVPHDKYEYALRFMDNNPSWLLINAAKDIVSRYQMSEWFDDEMSEVDEW